MFREIRKIPSRSRANYIRSLQYRGLIKAYMVNGHIAYDTSELKEYLKHTGQGRPPKIKISN